MTHTMRPFFLTVRERRTDAESGCYPVGYRRTVDQRSMQDGPI
jgi:hypothetical protein